MKAWKNSITPVTNEEERATKAVCLRRVVAKAIHKEPQLVAPEKKNQDEK